MDDKLLQQAFVSLLHFEIAPDEPTDDDVERPRQHFNLLALPVVEGVDFDLDS